MTGITNFDPASLSVHLSWVRLINAWQGFKKATQVLLARDDATSSLVYPALRGFATADQVDTMLSDTASLFTASLLLVQTPDKLAEWKACTTEFERDALWAELVERAKKEATAFNNTGLLK